MNKNPNKISAGVKARTHVYMTIVLLAWAIEYIIAKPLLVYYSSVNLMLFKYFVVFIIMGALKLAIDRRFTFQKRDIMQYVLAAFFGTAFYYYCEWSAMDYIPVASVSVMLALMPAVAVLGERILYKRAMTKLMVVGMITTVIGVIMVLGVSPSELIHGNLRGYLLAFGAVVGWSIMNFLGADTTQRYNNLDYGFYLVTFTLAIIIAMNVGQMPDLSYLNPKLILYIILLGTFCGVLNFLLLPSGLRYLGPTVAGVYPNFLPVVSALLAWAMLGEALNGLQLIGAVVVVFSSCMIIVEKGKVS